MSNKTSVSNASTYAEIGAFWDDHDATEFGDQTEVAFEVNIKSQRKYYALDSRLSSQLRQIAEKRGIIEETLLNLWIQEKLKEA